MSQIQLLFVPFVTLMVLQHVYGAPDVKIKQILVPDDCTVKAAKGDSVKVDYTGKLVATGQVFDSSKQEGRTPLEFVLGKGSVIQGWEEGILGMCVGEQRILTIPPGKAYGKRGSPPVIPPDAWLEFETEMRDIDQRSLIDSTYVVDLLKFLAIPVFICVICVHLYKKYNQETVEKRREKKQDRKKRR